MQSVLDFLFCSTLTGSQPHTSITHPPHHPLVIVFQFLNIISVRSFCYHKSSHFSTWSVQFIFNARGNLHYYWGINSVNIFQQLLTLATKPRHQSRHSVNKIISTLQTFVYKIIPLHPWLHCWFALHTLHVDSIIYSRQPITPLYLSCTVSLRTINAMIVTHTLPACNRRPCHPHPSCMHHETLPPTPFLHTSQGQALVRHYTAYHHFSLAYTFSSATGFHTLSSPSELRIFQTVTNQNWIICIEPSPGQFSTNVPCIIKKKKKIGAQHQSFVHTNIFFSKVVSFYAIYFNIIF